jgi:D-alanyl-lipoteichoic acid acyltransferase DltB (MBOAT superfamily)
VYGEPSRFSGPVLALATVFFAFQIFCDFSGYSDIAIGAARVMGFRLMRNFDRPYQATSIADFWRRWHISLSSWLGDYVFRPLSGFVSRRIQGDRVLGLKSEYLVYALPIALTFLLSGLWHGANWTFIVWGALHGSYLIAAVLTKNLRATLRRATGLSRHPSVLEALRIVTVFGLVAFSWIFFRARSLHDAAGICGGLIHGWGAVIRPAALAEMFRGIGLTIASVAVAGLVLVEVVQRLQARVDVQAAVAAQPWWVRWTLYYAGTASLYFLYAKEGQFIYFQF